MSAPVAVVVAIVKYWLVVSWRFSIVVTRWSRSMQLRYIEPG